MAEPKAKSKEQVKVVKVHAKIPPFVDLIKDVTIGSEAVVVEWHSWLQAQIDVGLLIEDEK